MPKTPRAMTAALILFAMMDRARAQERPPGIEEIVVTAERREASLEDIPVAVTALGGTDIERRELKEMMDLAIHVPGLSMDTVTGVPMIAMRGIGLEFSTIQGEPGVAVYTDGIYQARPYTSLSNFYSLERIEALRGPQGTLFGRNATGGVIHFVTKGPSDELEADAGVMYGSRETLRGRGSISGPLTDWLKARFGVVSEQQDGFVDNLVDGSKLHDRKVLSLRGAMTFEPTSYLNFRLNGDWQTDEVNGTAIKPLTENRATAAGGRIDPDPRKVYQDTDPFTNLEFGGVNLHSRLDLGFAAVEGIGGWAKSDSDAVFDGDGTDHAFFNLGKLVGAEQYSGEIHVVSPPDGRLTWIVGGFYFHEDGFDLLDGALEPNEAFPNGTARVRQHIEQQITKSQAVFGQATAELLWDFFLTFGIRYTKDHKRMLQYNAIDVLAVPEAVLNCKDLVTREGWSAFTPKVGLDWRGLEDTLVYASWSQGFKGGGINISGCGDTFDPEYVNAYEGGLKTRWFTDVLQTNIVGFWYDYTDIQQAHSVNLSSIVENASKAKITGIETEIAYVPFEWLSATAAVSYLNAVFLDYESTDERNGEDRNFAGNHLPRAPEWKAVIGLDFPLPLFDWGTMIPRIEWAYQTDLFFDFVNNPIDSQPAHSLWNANFSFASTDERVTLNAFAKNIADELLWANIQYNSAVDGTIAHPGTPRTLGVEAIMRF